MSQLSGNAAESLERAQIPEYQNRDHFSSMRVSNRGQMSAYRIKTDEDYDNINPHILRTIQHGENSHGLEVQNVNSNHTLQMKMMMSKMQSRMEEELVEKAREIERTLNKKWKQYNEENEFSSNFMTKNEVKRLLINEKESILLEARENQKIVARKEIHERFDHEIQDVEKRLSNKFENLNQENIEAIKYLNDKVKQCSEKLKDHSSFDNEIDKINLKLHELSSKANKREVKSYIGHDFNESDLYWEKVDSKLDKIYQYQRKINSPANDNEERKHMYDKFSESIVGLVQNLVQGKGPEKESTEATEFNHIMQSMNESVEKYKTHSNLGNYLPPAEFQNVNQERFTAMMNQMSDLVGRWGRCDDRHISMQGNSKDKVTADSHNGYEEENKKHIEEISNIWNTKFTDIVEEINHLHSCIDDINTDLTAWKKNDNKVQDVIQDSMKEKFEYFAKNINEIYTLMEAMKVKMKNRTQSKNNEVIFARLNGYGKNIKSLNELYKKVKEINCVCKKTVVDVGVNFKTFRPTRNSTYSFFVCLNS